MRTLTVVGPVLIGIVVAFLVAMPHRPQLSPAEQIAGLLNEGARAVEQRDLSRAMALVSSSYHDSVGFNRDRLRVFLAQAFRDPSRVRIDVGHPAVQIHGDEARVESTVTVETRGPGDVESSVSTHPITLRLRLEPTHRYLWIRDSTWRVVEADAPGLSDMVGVD